MKKLNEIQVVVLMGGRGTRLGKKVPKAMVDVHGKPFFQYQLELMRKQGFKKYLFCIGYEGAVVKKYFKNGKEFDVSITYSQDGAELLGTGGALRKALSLLEDDFMLIYGDSYVDVDYLDIIDAYFRIKNDILMVIYKNRNKYDKSNVIFDNKGLVDYRKNRLKFNRQFIDYGIAIIDRWIIEQLLENQFIDLSDNYEDWSVAGLISGYEVYNRFYEIGSSKSLEEFRKQILIRRI